MGSKVTFADIQLFDLFENPLGKFIPGFSAAPYSKLEAIANRVKASPEDCRLPCQALLVDSSFA